MLFALGLMSKPSLVTVPFLLLLLDAWPFARWEPFASGWWRSLLRMVPEKIPFFVLTVISCMATYSVQKAGNAVRDFSLASRLCNVPVAYLQYVRKLIYPADLAVIYPFNQVPPATALIAAAILVVISSIIFRFANRYRYAFVGWFWFIGVLVPMIGVVQ